VWSADTDDDREGFRAVKAIRDDVWMVVANASWMSAPVEIIRALIDECSNRTFVKACFHVNPLSRLLDMQQPSK
jgi:hypothetical protein